MLIKFLLYIFIYFFASIDYLLSFVPGISSLPQYVHIITDSIKSVFGFLHALLPSTASLFALYGSIIFFVWFTFFLLRTFKRFLPFLKPID